MRPLDAVMVALAAEQCIVLWSPCEVGQGGCCHWRSRLGGLAAVPTQWPSRCQPQGGASEAWRARLVVGPSQTSAVVSPLLPSSYCTFDGVSWASSCGWWSCRGLAGKSRTRSPPSPGRGRRRRRRKRWAAGATDARGIGDVQDSGRCRFQVGPRSPASPTLPAPEMRWRRWQQGEYKVRG